MCKLLKLKVYRLYVTTSKSSYILLPLLQDLVGRRCPIVVTMLLSAMGFLFVYQGIVWITGWLIVHVIMCSAYGDTPTKNAILMTIAGVWHIFSSSSNSVCVCVCV